MTRWFVEALSDWRYFFGFAWAMLGYESGLLRPLRERWPHAD